MEKRDLKIIEKRRGDDRDLNALYEEHLELELKLEVFNNRAYLTPQDELERKALQKQKLVGKDKLEGLLVKYREMETE